MTDFRIRSDYTLQGDQPQAVNQIVEGIRQGKRFQSRPGATGIVKTLTMAYVVERTVERRKELR